MSTEGMKYGLSLDGIKNFNNFYLKATFRYATGDVEYKSSSTTGDVSDEVYETSIAIGMDSEYENYLLSSYIGVGYRELNNDLRDLGSGGYRRKSRYVYIPIGVIYRIKVDKSSRVSTTVEYDYFVKGKQKSYLSDVNGWYGSTFGDPVNTQNHGFGFKISSSYEKKHWSAGVFFNYWKIKDSDVNLYTDGSLIYSTKEPFNTTKELGLELKLRF